MDPKNQLDLCLLYTKINSIFMHRQKSTRFLTCKKLTQFLINQLNFNLQNYAITMPTDASPFARYVTFSSNIYVTFLCIVRFI